MVRSALRIFSGNIRVFAITDLLGNFARGLVFPYASLYVLALGGNAAQIGLISFLGALAGLVLLPVAGHITDHADRIRLMVVAGFFYSLILGITVFAPSWQVLALASLLSGAVVVQFPAYASLIADSLSPEVRGQGLGMQNTISSSLAIFAPYIAGVIIERYTADLGMRILYGVMLLFGLAATIIQMRLLKEPSPARREPLHLSALVKALSQAYRGIPALTRQMSRPLIVLAVVITLSFVANGLATSFWVVFATERIGLSATQWGLILLVEAVVKMVLSLPAGMLVDRWGRTSSLVAALVISTLATPLFVVLRGFTAILLLRAVIAVAFVLAIPASTALMADLVPRAGRGQMMAAIGQGGLMLGPAGGGNGGPALGYLMIPPMLLASLAGGFLYALNPVYPWILSAVAGLLAIVLTVLFVRDPLEAEK
jgi:MFS family permease